MTGSDRTLALQNTLHIQHKIAQDVTDDGPDIWN